jgi:hypothetical protein
MRSQTGPGGDGAGSPVGWGERAQTGCKWLAPKAWAVLAGLGLYRVLADVVGGVDAFVTPVSAGRPDEPVTEALAFALSWLLVQLASVFVAPMFVGWLSGSRGWLYGLVTALSLWSPASAQSLLTLSQMPPEVLGWYGDALADMPWPAPLLAPLGHYIPALCLLPPLAMALVGALGGFCGEHIRFRRARASDA